MLSLFYAHAIAHDTMQWPDANQIKNLFERKRHDELLTGQQTEYTTLCWLMQDILLPAITPSPYALQYNLPEAVCYAAENRALLSIGPSYPLIGTNRPQPSKSPFIDYDNLGNFPKALLKLQENLQDCWSYQQSFCYNTTTITVTTLLRTTPALFLPLAQKLALNHEQHKKSQRYRNELIAAATCKKHEIQQTYWTCVTDTALSLTDKENRIESLGLRSELSTLLKQLVSENQKPAFLRDPQATSTPDAVHQLICAVLLQQHLPLSEPYQTSYELNEDVMPSVGALGDAVLQIACTHIPGSDYCGTTINAYATVHALSRYRWNLFNVSFNFNDKSYTSPFCPRNFGMRTVAGEACLDIPAYNFTSFALAEKAWESECPPLITVGIRHKIFGRNCYMSYTAPYADFKSGVTFAGIELRVPRNMSQALAYCAAVVVGFEYDKVSGLTCSGRFTADAL